jgi:hypothetical protein
MKKIIIALLLMNISVAVVAQKKSDDSQEETSGFKKENLFTGGDLELGFSTYGTDLGINPVLGYSINKWLDAGIAFNFDYNSEKYYDDFGNLYQTIRQTVYGPGAFLKFYPADFLFLQAQFEENFITEKYVVPGSNPVALPSATAPSFLVGIGYAGGREGTRSLFYYIAVLADVAGNANSPYLDHTYNSDGTPASSSIIPIIRAGLQVPLFQGRTDRY